MSVLACALRNGRLVTAHMRAFKLFSCELCDSGANELLGDLALEPPYLAPDGSRRCRLGDWVAKCYLDLCGNRMLPKALTSSLSKARGERLMQLNVDVDVNVYDTAL